MITSIRLKLLIIAILVGVELLAQHSQLPNMIPYRKGIKWGYCDKNKNIVIACNYDEVRPFSNGVAAVKIGNYWGYINRYGQMVIPAKYLEAHDFENNFAIVKVSTEQKYILITITGIEIDAFFSPSFPYVRKEFKDFIRDVDLNRIMILHDNRLGYINQQGDTVIKPTFFPISPKHSVFRNGLTKVFFNNNWYLIDTLGLIINEIESPYSLKMRDRVVQYERNEKYFLVDARTNKALSSQSFDNLWYMANENYIRVAKGKKWGVLDYTGKQIIPIEFTDIFENDHEILLVKKGKKSAYFNLQGKEITPFDDWRSTSKIDSLIAVMTKKGVSGVYDLQGNIILPPKKYDFIELLTGNKIIVKEGSYIKLITSDGTLIKIFESDKLTIKDFNEKGFFVQNNNYKYGYLSKNSGEWIINPSLRQIVILNKYLALGQKENNSSVILDSNGQEIIQNVNNVYYIDNFYQKIIQIIASGPIRESYDFTRYFTVNEREKDGLLIECENHWLFVDKYGNQLANIKKSSTMPNMKLEFFSNGLSEVTYDEGVIIKRRGFIDYQGNQYWEDINLLEPKAREEISISNITPKLYVPIGHSAWIINLETSKDGRFAVTASMDGYAILWDLKLGKELRRFKKEGAMAVSCDISNNEKIILLGRSNGEIEMWNLQTGELITSQKEHSGIVNSIKFSHDDKMFVSSGDDGQIIIWDSSLMKKIIDFQGGNDLNINRVCFIPNRNEIIAAFNDGSAKILNYSTGSIVLNLKGHYGEVYDVAVSPDGRYFLTGCSDGKIRLWNSNGTLLNIFSDFNDEVTRVTFSADGKYFAAGGGGDHSAKDFSIRVYRIDNKTLVKTLKGHTFTITGIKFLPDSKRILSTSWDMTLKLWNIEDGSLIKELKGLVGIPKKLTLKSNNNIMVVSDDGTLKVIDLQDGKTTKVIMAHPDGCSDLFVSGNSIFTSGNNGSINEWDINTYKLKRTYKNINERAEAVVAAETYVVSVSYDGNLVFWNRKSGEKLYSTMAHPEKCASMTISHDQKWIATGGKTGNIKIWNADNPAANPLVLTGHKTIIQALAFSTDNYLVSGEGALNSTEPYSSLKIWKIPEGKLIKTINHHRTAINVVASIPAKKMIASGSMDGKVNLWDLENFSLIKSLDLESVATTIESTPNGEFIFIGLSDGTIRIIETNGLTEIAKQISFSDGNWITITRDYYYTGSKGAIKNLTYEYGPKIYSFDQFDLQYNRPHIVLECLGLASPELIQAYQKAYEKRLRKMGFNPSSFEKEFRLQAPEVKLKPSETLFVETSEPNYTLTFSAEDILFNLERYFVTVNGVPLYGLQGKKFPIAAKKAEQTITIPLSTGINNIKISALNQKGVESLAEQIEVTYNPQIPLKPNLYVIAVGVSKFKQSEYNLTYADKDAADIVNLFKQQSSKYGEVKTFLLQNQQSTIENILALRSELEKSTPDDQIVMFFASHGLLDSELDYYLATHDVDFSQPQKRGLGYDKLEVLLDGIPARKKLLLIDACHSGEIDKEENQLIANSQAKDTTVKSRGFKTIKKTGLTVDLKTSFELMKELFTDVRRNNGTVVISSAGGEEFSYETETLQNGVFTYCVIEGLQHAKADLNADKKINVSELATFVGERVKELTGGKQNPTNRAENIDTDFPIWGQ